MSAPKQAVSIPVASRPVQVPAPSKASLRANVVVASVVGVLAIAGAVAGIAVTW